MIKKSTFLDLQEYNLLQMYSYPARLRVARRRRKLLWFYTSEIRFSFGNQGFSRIFYNDWKNQNLRFVFDKQNNYLYYIYFHLITIFFDFVVSVCLGAYLPYFLSGCWTGRLSSPQNIGGKNTVLYNTN